MLACAVLASFWLGLVSADVLCPDGNACPDKNTCCLTNGRYGCCIYPLAICCSDQLHCCPAGYHCSDAAQSCVKDGLPWLRLPWHRNTPALAPKAVLPQTPFGESEDNVIQEKPSDVSVVHCDNVYFCPDGTTCCKSPHGLWSCCKYTVVSFKEPQNALLELSSYTSNDNGIQKSWSEAVGRCDNLYYCPSGTTCCRSPYGTWSCCRTLLGLCCRDGKHCCPYGFHCDTTSSQCLMGRLRIAASPRLPALRYDENQDPCCLGEAGCCLEGFYCDRKLKACVRDLAGPVPWASLIQAPGDSSLGLSGVIRCDGRFYCPSGNSCCQSSTGAWGCCPYRLGQCCSDGKHCCDYKWKCDDTSLSCKSGDSSIPWASMGEIQQL